MSLKRFRIEQLFPSIDSMISLFFCTLRHYVIINFNVNENTCSIYTAKRMIPRGSHNTQFELVGCIGVERHSNS